MVFDVRRRSSLLGLLTGAALLLGQLAGVVHMAAVQHQRCLEHGELVHATARPNRDSHVASASSQQASYSATRTVANAPAPASNAANCTNTIDVSSVQIVRGQVFNRIGANSAAAQS